MPPGGAGWGGGVFISASPAAGKLPVSDTDQTHIFRVAASTARRIAFCPRSMNRSSDRHLPIRPSQPLLPSFRSGALCTRAVSLAQIVAHGVPQVALQVGETEWVCASVDWSLLRRYGSDVPRAPSVARCSESSRPSTASPRASCRSLACVLATSAFFCDRSHQMVRQQRNVRLHLLGVLGLCGGLTCVALSSGRPLECAGCASYSVDTAFTDRSLASAMLAAALASCRSATCA